jgi:hypothetical protein
LAMTLDAILYKTLHKLMGRKFFKCSGLETLGIKTITESQKPIVP